MLRAVGTPEALDVFVLKAAPNLTRLAHASMASRFSGKLGVSWNASSVDRLFRVLAFVVVCISQLAVTQGATVKLTKTDIMSLLTGRNVKFRKGAKKSDLLSLLLSSVLPDLLPIDVDNLLAKHKACGAGNEDEKLVSSLEKDSLLADAVEALASLDHETAQAFPEFTRAAKIRKDISLAKTMKTDLPVESDSESNCSPSSSSVSVPVLSEADDDSESSSCVSHVTVLSFRDVDESPSRDALPPLRPPSPTCQL